MNTEATAVEERAAVHAALSDPQRLRIADALAVSDRTPGELRALLGVDWNLLAFHLGVLESAGVVARTVSHGDRRRRYVRLVPERLAQTGPAPDLSLRIRRPLFVCTHNSARSQFAAALWRERTGRAAGSAGSQPAAAVHPLAVAAAKRLGVDLSTAVPRGYDEVRRRPDLVVSVCDRAREAQPPFDVPTLHWSIPDPAGGRRAAFDRAFREITGRVDRLVDLAA